MTIVGATSKNIFGGFPYPPEKTPVLIHLYMEVHLWSILFVPLIIREAEKVFIGVASTLYKTVMVFISITHTAPRPGIEPGRASLEDSLGLHPARLATHSLIQTDRVRRLQGGRKNTTQHNH
jgi:hypothetical protein